MTKKDWMIRESELDDDQLKVLQATLDRSCVAEGCAGSGKSVLALIKAQRVQKERGNNYQIIVFTKALCRYMNSGRETLGLKNDFWYYWDWKYRNNCPDADYVIVDEIQDFDEQEIQDFLKATNKHFFFFGDTAQSIYNGLPTKTGKKKTVPVEDIASFAKGQHIKTFPLYRNYRLPLPVARLVQYVGVDLDPFEESTYKSKENEKPYVLQYSSTDNQLQAIADIIKNKSLTDVAILLPHNWEVETVADILRAKGLNVEQKSEDKQNWKNSIDNLDFSTQNPKVMTYHSAKGLQFEAVFLPCIPCIEDAYSDDSRRKALYVAMTRTYKLLYVMYTGTLPNPLNEIPQSLYNTETGAKLDII